MIAVKFDVEKDQCEKEHLAFASTIMPWLEYLTTNSLEIKTDRVHCPATFLDTITYKFYLKEKHETFYRLKYPID